MKRLLVLVTTASSGLALAGCASTGAPAKPSAPKAAAQSASFSASSPWRSADPAAVRRDVMNFADRFAGGMADT